MAKLKLKKGDTVKIIAGNAKGEQGLIKAIDTKKMRVTVEGKNMVKRHTKPNATHPDGGIIEKEAPMHISNVMLVDAAGNATRVGRKEGDKGLVRYSKKSGETLK